MNMKITGRIKKVFFTNNVDWAAISIQSDDGNVYRAAGKILNPAAGLQVTLTGEMVNSNTENSSVLKVQRFTLIIQ